MPEGSAKDRLCEFLRTVDTSMGFLLLILVSLLLSLSSLVLQRKGLCLTIQGDSDGAAALPPVFPLKCRASALVVGSLGFFLCLSLKSLKQAEEDGDPGAICSARTNVLASVLVLAAAVLRWEDLHFLEQYQTPMVEDDLLPD